MRREPGAGHALPPIARPARWPGVVRAEEESVAYPQCTPRCAVRALRAGSGVLEDASLATRADSSPSGCRIEPYPVCAVNLRASDRIGASRLNPQTAA